MRKLCFGQGGSERGHGSIETRRAKGDDIHVPLGNDQRLTLARRLSCGPVIVESSRLVEQLGLGRIQILGVFLGIERPATEGDATSARIPYREHDPAPKGVVWPAVLAAGL